MVSQNGFQNSTLKHLVHHMLIQEIGENYFNLKRKISVFTLPGTSMALEDSLKLTFGRNIELTGVEHDPEVFAKAQAKFKEVELKMDLTCESDQVFWSRTPKKFDFIWLDYCGPWAPGKEHAFETLFSRGALKFTKNSTPMLALTVCEGRDFHSLGSLVLLAKNKCNKRGNNLKFLARIGGIPLRINEMANKHGITLVPELVIRYRDKTLSHRAATMLMFLFHVDREVHPVDVLSSRTIDLVQEVVRKVGRASEDHRPD